MENINNIKSEYNEYFFLEGRNILLSLIKYNLIDSCSFSAGDEETNKALLFYKLENLTYKDNVFIKYARSEFYGQILLQFCIENPKVSVLLKMINNIYDKSSYELLRDMFYTISVIIEPMVFVLLLCELYIAHINKEWNVDTYCTNAIFNLFFEKKSTKKMFYKVILYPYNSDILTPHQRDLSQRMMKAIMKLNTSEWLHISSYNYTVEDIFNVDIYLNKTWSGSPIFQ